MHFIALHGFTQKAERFAERAGLPEACESLGWQLHTPQAPSFRNWRPHKDDLGVADLAESLDGPVILAGFSDGARTALRAALLVPANRVAAVVFHSGMFRARDVASLTYLPWHFLAVGGDEDRTPTNPHDAIAWAEAMAEKSIGPTVRDFDWYPHHGGHEWTPEQNKYIFAFCKPREVGHVA